MTYWITIYREFWPAVEAGCEQSVPAQRPSIKSGTRCGHSPSSYIKPVSSHPSRPITTDHWSARRPQVPRKASLICAHPSNDTGGHRPQDKAGEYWGKPRYKTKTRPRPEKASPRILWRCGGGGTLTIAYPDAEISPKSRWGRVGTWARDKLGSPRKRFFFKSVIISLRADCF